MKKIIILLIFVLLVGCSSSSNDNSLDIEHIDWSEYDQLIEKANIEQNIDKRNEMLHKAEDMIIDSGAIIPLFNSIESYLLKSDVSGIYIDSLANLQYSHIYSPGKNSLNLGIILEVPNADPQQQLLQDVSYLWNGIGATLLTYDENDNLICSLADHYDVSEDGLVYTFYLKDNLKWSDGKELTANDFVYSWKRAADPINTCEAADFIKIVKGFPYNLAVEASSDGKIFTVTLNEPCVYFASLTAYNSFGPLRQDVIESAPGYKDSSGKISNPFAWSIDGVPISCGPYVLESWKHNESMVLKKNPYYYDADSIKTETLNLMLSSDSTVKYAAYVSGDISLLVDAIPTDILETLYDNPEYHYSESLSTSWIFFSTTSDIFKGMSAEDAKTFRKAIGYCIDRVFISQILSNPLDTVSSSIVPERTLDGSGHYYGEYGNKKYPYEHGYYPDRPDLDKAREMLESIGYEFDNSGKLKNPINLEYLTNSGAGNEAVATCIQADLAQIGINLTVSTLEWSVFLGERKNGNYELCRGSWSLDFNDPFSILSIFSTDNPNNDSQLGR